MLNLEKHHWEGVKQIFMYLNGTLKWGLVYEKANTSIWCLIWYTNVDFVGNLDRRRSMIEYAFTLNGNLVSWKSSL